MIGLTLLIYLLPIPELENSNKKLISLEEFNRRGKQEEIERRSPIWFSTGAACPECKEELKIDVCKYSKTREDIKCENCGFIQHAEGKPSQEQLSEFAENMRKIREYINE